MAKNPKSIKSNPKTHSSNKAVVHQSLTAQQFTGPIPPPNILEEYDRIHPGSADRIIKMAENEQLHRHAIEKQIVDAEIVNTAQEIKNHASEIRWGQWLGFSIGVVTIVAGSIVSIHNQPFSGTLIGTGGVAGLVAVFIMGRKNESAPQQKQENMPEKPDK